MLAQSVCACVCVSVAGAGKKEGREEGRQGSGKRMQLTGAEAAASCGQQPSTALDDVHT